MTQDKKHAVKAPTTVDDALGGLTAEAIKAVKDSTLRKQLEAARSLARGVAEAVLGKTDAEKARAALLNAGGITLADAVGLADDGVTLIEEAADRDVKAAAFHAAVEHVNETEQEIGDHISSARFILRGKFGPKSPELKNFGFAPLAPGGRRAKKAAEPVKP